MYPIGVGGSDLFPSTGLVPRPGLYPQSGAKPTLAAVTPGTGTLTPITPS
jgi:hypothetical protein